VNNPGPKDPAFGIEHGVAENSKSQISNLKQITMTKIQNSKPLLVIGNWNLRFVCYLVLGVWDFKESMTSLLQIAEWVYRRNH
jgi:hypothetical protein